MKTRALLTTILLSALLITACSPEELAALDEAQNKPEIALQSGGGAQADANGQAATLLGQEGGNVTSQDGDGGNIAANGQQSADPPTSNEAGLMPGTSAGSAPGEAAQAKPINWLTYISDPYKFSIQYPDSFVILPEVDLLAENVSPGLVHQVRFQTRALAEGDTAALEQPQFMVEVFTFAGQTSLDGFIKTLLPFSNMTIESYSNGKVSGLRASTNRMLAPNEFYFFAGNGVVYKLTPLGKYSPEMLQSFAILP